MKKIIAIGALGGSGTRVIAQAFLQMGIYLGDDLNVANDNLLFTRLFKNPIWYLNSSIKQRRHRLDIFQKYMEGQDLNSSEIKEILQAAANNPTIQTNLHHYRTNLSSLTSNRPKNDVWGWKEPNTQIFTSEILDFFPTLKYIHVVRHGLDMAFSSNLQQLHNWGWKYGIKINGNESKNELAIKQLEYWVKTTQAILAESRLQSRIHLLNYTEFCLSPKKQIKKIIDFCGLSVHPKVVDEVITIPNFNLSNNRYKNYDLTIFPQSHLDFVQKCGFEINCANQNTLLHSK